MRSQGPNSTCVCVFYARDQMHSTLITSPLSGEAELCVYGLTVDRDNE